MALIANRLERLFDRQRFPFTLLVVAIVFSACLMPAQSDTWWHLRTGEEIWRSGRIVLQDDFTHTVSGRPWPDHEWLTQVVFYAVYVVGGLPLLTVLCAAAITVAWLIVLSLTPGPVLVRVALVGGGAALSSGAWSLRPQVLTMALFAATLWVLARRRYLWSLPPLFLLWANLHGAVALGGVLIVAATLASLRAGDGRFKHADSHRRRVPLCNHLNAAWLIAVVGNAADDATHRGVRDPGMARNRLIDVG